MYSVSDMWKNLQIRERVTGTHYAREGGIQARVQDLPKEVHKQKQIPEPRNATYRGKGKNCAIVQ